MATSKLEAFLLGAKTRFGWSEIIAILVPVFLEMLQKWLENCASTEDEAVDLLTCPRPFQVLIARRAIVGELRRNPGNSLNARERIVAANRLIADVVEHANEDPAAVCAAFREAVGA
jgi:hypothetical protein